MNLCSNDQTKEMDQRSMGIKRRQMTKIEDRHNGR